MSLPIALGVRMRAKKKMATGGQVEDAPQGKTTVSRPDAGWGAIIGKAHGGEVDPVFDHKDLAQAVIKKMSGGGEVEPTDDFLSSDEDSELNSVGMPDDSDERAEEMSSKGMLKSIMAKRRK